VPSPVDITFAQLTRLAGTPDLRDGVRAGAKRVEADPWDDSALCFGLGESPKRIAATVLGVFWPTAP
jgi:hypothetical protein